MTEMWDGIIGQAGAVGVLRRAATRPSHAYLVTGPPGSGAEHAARCFAASLVCPAGGCGLCSACDRVLRHRHPDVAEVEPEGSNLLVEQVAEITRETFASPCEADRRVVLVFEAERMNESAAGKLLKTLEEPPPRAHLVLVTSSPDDLLGTIRSRCQRVDLAGVPEQLVVEALVAEGAASEVAVLAARLAGGRLDRARAFAAGGLAPLRRSALDSVIGLDGRGAAVARAIEEIEAALGLALEQLEDRHKEQRAELDDELARADYPDRVVKRLRRDMDRRHERAERRARGDLLAEVITSIMSWMRDGLVDGVVGRNSDRPRPPFPPRACLACVDACRHGLAAAERHTALNERLLLQHMLLRCGTAIAG